MANAQPEPQIGEVYDTKDRGGGNYKDANHDGVLTHDEAVAGDHNPVPAPAAPLAAAQSEPPPPPPHRWATMSSRTTSTRRRRRSSRGGSRLRRWPSNF